MLANLPVEIVLLICEYPEFKELRQLAWTSKRMMQIIKKYLPAALDRRILFYLSYKNSEGRICLFDSHTNSVDYIAKFTNHLCLYEIITTKDKIFALDSEKEPLEIFDLNTRRITRGPNPPEWRNFSSVACFRDKLYSLGGKDPKTYKDTNRVDVLINGKWQTGPAFPLPISEAQAITCNEILYVIDGDGSKKIYRLSDDEREWVEIGEIPERRGAFGVASLNERIYIIGGYCHDVDHTIEVKSCLCFDPSAPVDSRISRITDMNYGRHLHSLIVANGKLYAIGGRFFDEDFRNSVEEYDPLTNKWREVEKINIK